MADMNSVLLDILKDIKTNQEKHFERTDARQDKLETALTDMATGINKLTVVVAKMEENQEHLQVQQSRQLEIDEAQNNKIEYIKDDIRELDKKLTKLDEVPEQVKKNKHTIGNIHNKVEALDILNQELDAKVRKIEDKVELLKEESVANRTSDSIKWGITEQIAKWIVPVLLGVTSISGIGYFIKEMVK